MPGSNPNLGKNVVQSLKENKTLKNALDAMKNTPIPVAVRMVDTAIRNEASLYRIFNCWRSSWKVFKGKYEQLRITLINLLRVVEGVRVRVEIQK